MTREALVSKKEAGGLFALLAVLLVIGSIFDFQISQALYNESNPIANFFAAYGEYPAMLGFAASGALLVIGRNRQRRVVGALQLLGLLPRLDSRLAGKRRLLAGIGFAWACVVAFTRIVMGAHYLTDTVVGLAVGLGCLLFVNWLVFGRAPAGGREA